MKHQLAIYFNNQADGINSCLCTDTVAGPAEATTKLQPVIESIQGLSDAVMALVLKEIQTGPAASGFYGR